MGEGRGRAAIEGDAVRRDLEKEFRERTYPVLVTLRQWTEDDRVVRNKTRLQERGVVVERWDV